MQSKSKILEAIRAAKLPSTDLPEIPLFPMQGESPQVLFQKMIKEGGGKVFEGNSFENYNQMLGQLYPEAKQVASTVPDLQGNYDLLKVIDPIDLKDIDVAIIRGQIGVAENGAIWVSEKETVHRVLPFIAQHLILFVDKTEIVRHMHEAYSRIRINETGFGVFIAGPSKTADIEQSLVIGAHGPRSLTVILD